MSHVPASCLVLVLLAPRWPITSKQRGDLQPNPLVKRFRRVTEIINHLSPSIDLQLKGGKITMFFTRLLNHPDAQPGCGVNAAQHSSCGAGKAVVELSSAGIWVQGGSQGWGHLAGHLHRRSCLGRDLPWPCISCRTPRGGTEVHSYLGRLGDMSPCDPSLLGPIALPVPARGGPATVGAALALSPAGDTGEGELTPQGEEGRERCLNLPPAACVSHLNPKQGTVLQQGCPTTVPLSCCVSPCQPLGTGK